LVGWIALFVESPPLLLLLLVLLFAGSVAAVHHFESHLGAFREHLEVEVSRLTAAAQQLTEQGEWWDNPSQVHGCKHHSVVCIHYSSARRFWSRD
jgi:hypothetical protein